MNKIKSETLEPSRYYIILDFQNPWEVSWETEPLYYQDYYIEIESVPVLAGIRNASHLIVLASSKNTLNPVVQFLENPEWIVHYDPYYLGEEHVISLNNIQYGFRKTKDSEGNDLYLSCKGQITYLKDEFGNEGNFNFRLLMFELDGLWRYCVDNTLSGLFGKFAECYNNKFYINDLLIVTLVFLFTPEKFNDTITGYTIQYAADNVLMSKGYKLRLQGLDITNNSFNILELVDSNPVIIDINSSIISNNTFFRKFYNFIKITNKETSDNTFLDISGPITINAKSINNTFKDFKKDLVINIECRDNIISKYSGEEALEIQGEEFNNNCIENITGNIKNYKKFNNNTIINCSSITNKGLIIDNKINNILTHLENILTIKNTNIDTIDNLVNNMQIISSTINIIRNITSDSKGTIKNSNINILEESEILGIIDNTDINIINNSTIGLNGNIINNELYDLESVIINGEFSNNFIKESINNCEFNTFTNNISLGSISDCHINTFSKNRIYDSIIGLNSSDTSLNSSDTITDCVFNHTINQLTCTKLINCHFDFIDNLHLTKECYYTTFHGNISNPDNLSQYEYLLLGDSSKKKEAFPNIKIVSIPDLCMTGMIVMWSGTVETIPKGWAICDGTNGTPNLIDKFIKGSYTPNVESGNKDNIINLKIDLLAPHTHKITGTVFTNWDGEHTHSYTAPSSGVSDNANDRVVQTGTTSDETGYAGGHTHEVNLSSALLEVVGKADDVNIEPEAYSLIFIMKLDY